MKHTLPAPNLTAFAVAGVAVAIAVLSPASAEPATAWPDVLVIDDFESGLAKWTHEDAGTLEVSNDAPQGGKALLWTAGDDGVGNIVFRALARTDIDFSQYDLLTFWVKIDGKPIWNLNPVVQQHPAVYGYRGLYYSIDTLYPFGTWFLFAQDLTRWENAWPNTYSRDKQEFRFEVHQLAGAGSTRIHIDAVRLLKNPLGVRPSYHGEWRANPDGSQATRFRLALRNRGDKPLTVTVAAAADDPGTVRHFKLSVPPEPVTIPAGDERRVEVSLSAAADVLADQSAWYGETARLAVSVTDVPGLVVFTELTAGSRPAAVAHPSILCQPTRMADLQAAWADPPTQAVLDQGIRHIVRAGEKALDYRPEYPPTAAPGRTKDPVTGAKLVETSVPNLPFRVYQDPASGRTYSGPLYDAGMQGWATRHRTNASTAEVLGKAYLVSGRRDVAEAAAAILRAYVERYLDMPIVAAEAGSPVGSVSSGSARIGGSFMNERRWLGALATALDCIRPAGVLSADEIHDIAERVFIPSAALMLDHKVGVMNLQWMIQSACLFAGLAVEDPGLVARAVYDRHGVIRLTEKGFLPGGQWWENPSYQGVAKLAAYPALAACVDNGIMSWSDRLSEILKAAYKLHGPDGRSPTLGTGGYRTYSFEDTGVFMFASAVDDPELAWILYNRKVQAGTYDLYHHALLRGGTSAIPPGETVEPFPKATTNLPNYGGIVLRVAGTDRYCYFHYGRELVHGHRNKLSINAYGAGGWFARNVMGGYNHRFADFLETNASANGIMVDGAKADADTGELLFRGTFADGAVTVASGREIGAWKDVEHERTVVLSAGPMIVLDRCVADAEHTYDWLYHPNECGDLKLVAPPVLDAGIDTFGSSPRYAGLPPLGKLPGGKAMAWSREDGSGVGIAVRPAGELFLTEVRDTFRPHQSLLWRQRGAVCTFAAAFLPHAAATEHRVAVEAVAVTAEDGKQVGPDQAQAVRVTSSQGDLIVLVNYSGRTLSAGEISSAERVAVGFGKNRQEEP